MIKLPIVMLFTLQFTLLSIINCCKTEYEVNEWMTFGRIINNKL